MPVAVIMIGTIIGDISTAIIGVRNGREGRLNPRAARVPSAVAGSVAAMAMTKLFFIAWVHCGLSSISRYQRRDHASGSKDNMPRVKVKYGSVLKESGTTTSIGPIKKTITRAAKVLRP